MTMKDDDGSHRQQTESDDGSRESRDERGRWLPGHCPNPKGRPRKRLFPEIDESDLKIYGNMMIEFSVNGERRLMDRRTALLNKIFEGAMKGKVSNQRFLYKLFEENDQRMAETRMRYNQLIFDWHLNPDRRNRGLDIPHEVELEILSLQAVLHHYYPSQYRCPREPDEHCPDCSIPPGK